MKSVKLPREIIDRIFFYLPTSKIIELDCQYNLKNLLESNTIETIIKYDDLYLLKYAVENKKIKEELECSFLDVAIIHSSEKILDYLLGKEEFINLTETGTDFLNSNRVRQEILYKLRKHYFIDTEM